ncbi:unnamed protein product [Rhizoctonia solani]|uniref:Uncharacterized protein n=1 Tax=Rhizoctonia solani TaxID=456999 RepID=A0A8H3CTH7_9AGAM|nr:unnamed protein product [Rhizoctonia solani]
MNASNNSISTRSVASEMLTVVYQEGTGGEVHYASIPLSSNYEEVLGDARQCFEGYLPNNPKVELKHEIGEGRWASIHPRLFGNLVQGFRVKEFKLSVRQTLRSDSTSGSGTNNANYTGHATLGVLRAKVNRPESLNQQETPGTIVVVIFAELAR